MGLILVKYFGSFLVALILLPNAAFFLFPPVNIPERQTEKTRSLKALELVEHISRFFVLLLPLFRRTDDITVSTITIGCMILAFLALYYALFARYFMRGREYSLLFSPFLFIPVPLAVFPVSCFLLYALMVQSLIFDSAIFIFAACHIVISYGEFLRLSKCG